MGVIWHKLWSELRPKISIEGYIGYKQCPNLRLNTQMTPNKQWLILAKNGDHLAFSKIVRKYQNPIYNLCYRCSDKHFGSVGWAALCPTRHRIGMRQLRVKIFFLKTISYAQRCKRGGRGCPGDFRADTKLDSYNDSRLFSTWLFSIASHYCLDQLRRRRVRFTTWDKLISQNHLVTDGKEPEKTLLETETTQEVYALLNMLPSEYRAALILKYWHAMSYQEIAQTLDTTVSAIKSKLFRARKMMADTAAQQRNPIPFYPRPYADAAGRSSHCPARFSQTRR